MKTNRQENWPAPIPLARPNPMRAVVAKQTEEFLKKGGKITKLPPQSSGKYAKFNRSGL